MIWWTRFKAALHNFYTKFGLYEGVFFLCFLAHRYRPGQMDLKNTASNFRTLLRISDGEWIETTPKGKLRLLSTKWEKCLFFLKNLFFMGAFQSRVEKVVYFTYITLSLELNNPFDKTILMFFLEKKRALLARLLKKIEKINGKQWRDFAHVRKHLEAFHRNSLLQYRVIRTMHAAVRRQKVPPIVRDAQAALNKGLYPILITMGFSGSYWMRSTDRRIAGLFKPFDEEIHAPNNPIGPLFQGALGQRKTRWGCRVGEAAHHEVGAFLVDKFLGFGIVPKTYYAEFTHRTFYLAREDRFSLSRPNKTKYGSFQEFVDGFVPLTDVIRKEKNFIPLIEYQLLVILDVIIGNTDRNTGNILIGDEKIAAIDHGLSFPDKHADLSYWYWNLDNGKEPLIPSLIELLIHFPFEELACKLKKNCFISQNSVERMRERIALFTEAVRAGFVPNQLIDLMTYDYLYPLSFYTALLPEKAKEQVDLYRLSIQLQ